MTPVRLEPAALRSRVKHSTTEPLRSLPCVCDCSFPGHVHLFYGLFDLILYIPDNIVFPGHVHLFFGTTEVTTNVLRFVCLS